MIDAFSGLMAWCRPEAGSLAPALLLAGLAGGVLHCAPMCGPFVLGQVADRMAGLPAGRLCQAARLRGALLLPYHAGRIMTYSALGALAGGGIGFVGSSAAAALLLLAAILFTAQALIRLRPKWRLALTGGYRLTRLGALVRHLATYGDTRSWSGGLVLGLALGFLPCGLLYAALAAAAGSRSASHGALAMAAFGAGTVPALVIVGQAGQAAGQRFHAWMLRAAPVLLLLNALLLAGMAWRIFSGT